MEAAILLFLFASFLLLLGCFVFVGWYLVMRRLRKKHVLLQSNLESLQKQLKQRNNIKSDNSKGNSTANGTETVEWRVRVPKELDDDVQTFMNTFRFGEQMDMAQLLDNALSSYMMVEVSRKMREASRGLDMSESE